MAALAIVSMLVIVLAHHLGFVDKAYQICGQIAQCQMCCSMWGTLFVLLVSGCRFFEAIALAFGVAYLSNWVGIPLYWLSNKYDELWQRQNRRSRSRSNSRTSKLERP